MNLLIVDVETTGLKRSEGSLPIEVGAILFSITHRAPLQSLSFLLPADENPAAHINGIEAALTTEPQPWVEAMDLFQHMAGDASYTLAHNAEFDRKWFGVGQLAPINLPPWICTMSEICWRSAGGRSLRDLALAHGIAVMPTVHRALPDCELLAAVLAKRDDLEDLLVEALLPRRLYRALVSYDEREKAKSQGFRWNSELKQWRRKLTAAEVGDLQTKGLQLVPVPI